MPDLVEQKVRLRSADRYGRTITMTRKSESRGAAFWSIEVEPASQRDEGERITGCLTDQNIADMIDALKVVQRV